MRIDGVSRETEPPSFCYIRRYYRHCIVIPLMILTGNDHAQMTADKENQNNRLFQNYSDFLHIIKHLLMSFLVYWSVIDFVRI